MGKPSRESQYILLDGHTRLVALKQLGFDKAPCLVATNDESYTYNNRVNRLSSIQEHLMIRRAVGLTKCLTDRVPVGSVIQLCTVRV